MKWDICLLVDQRDPSSFRGWRLVWTLLNKNHWHYISSSLSWIFSWTHKCAKIILQTHSFTEEMKCLVFDFLLKYRYSICVHYKMQTEMTLKTDVDIVSNFCSRFLKRLFAKASSNLTAAQSVQTLFYVSWRPVWASQCRELRVFCVLCNCLFEVNFGNRGWDSSAAQTGRY